MKRMIALTLTVALLAAMTLSFATGNVLTPKASAKVYTLGDCNLDGHVDMKDVLLLRQYMSHMAVTLNLKVADTNQDNSADMKDVLAIRKYMAHVQSLGTVDISETDPTSGPTTPTTVPTVPTQPGDWGNGEKIDPDNPRINFLKDTGHTLGVWWWETFVKDPLLTEYMDLLQQNQVTEIYYEGYTLLYAEGGFEKLHSFVELAMARGMRVAILFDDKADVMNSVGIGETWQKVIDGYMDYKKQYPSDAVYAIHTDIEPHISSEGVPGVQKYITNFIEQEVALARGTLKLPDLKYKEYNIPVELDLPCGWESQGTDKMKRADETTGPVYEILAQSCDCMTLMSYRDSYDKVYSLGYAPLQAGSKYGTKVNFGFEFGNSGEVQTVDFHDEDRYYAYNQIKQTMLKIERKDWNCQVGFAIHSMKGWYDLRPTGYNQ